MGRNMKAGTDYIGVAVGVLLINETGEVFLTKRGPHATNERGTWEIPGGKVRFGETLTAAARREMREEYGVDITLTHRFPAQDHLLPDERQHWVPTCFLGRISAGMNPRIMEPDKCEAVGWFALDRLPEPLSVITTTDIRTYRRFLAHEDLNLV